jgi:DNA-binding PadR family transcriptional regulator
VNISSRSIKQPYSGPLSPEFALLGFLSLGAAHGYELHQRLVKELGQVWHISLSQTYNILNRLEGQGLIEGEVQEAGKLPARRVFRLTPAGGQRFDAWLHTPSKSSVRAIRVEFTTRLYFASATDPGLTNSLIEEQTAVTRASLNRLQTMLAEISAEQVFNRLGLELRIRQLTSILDWLSDCHRLLERKP